MRRLLFVCERNTVLGPAATAIFHHMGVSLLRSWEVSAVGWSQAIEVNNNDLCKMKQILQKQAVPFKPRGRKTVRAEDLVICDLILCFEMKTWCGVLDMLGPDQEYKVKMLADFYPDFHLTEISDPLHDRDAKSYEKSYWLVYKSVRELVRSLKEEMRPQTPKTKTVQLDDPALVSLCKEKELFAPKVEKIQVSRPTLLAGEKYSPPDLGLNNMEEPLLVEVRDHLNLPPPRKKILEECEVLKIQWNIIPSCQYRDTTDRHLTDWSLKPPQLSMESGEMTGTIVTNQADLFDQVKMLRPSFIRFRI